MVTKEQVISSNEIAGLNYSIKLKPSMDADNFESLLVLPLFQQMAAFPFNSVSKSPTKKMDTAIENVKEHIQLEDSDFPPKKERVSKFSEPIYDEYLKSFIKKIGKQKVMILVNSLIDANFLKIPKRTQKNKKTGETEDVSDKEFQFLTIATRNRLIDEGTTLEDLDSNLEKILGYKYEQGTGKTEKTDNELMDAIDASKPVLFPDEFEKNISVNHQGDEIKVTIDTEKYFQTLFKEYGFGDIDAFEDNQPLFDLSGKPKKDKTGKQKKGRLQTKTFQFPITELPKDSKRTQTPMKERPERQTDEEMAASNRRLEFENKLREQFEDEESIEITEEVFDKETDLERYIEDKNGDKKENPKWIKAYDEWHGEKFEEWKDEQEFSAELDLEQYDEDDANEAEEDDTPSDDLEDYSPGDNPKDDKDDIEEKMLKAIEIVKAIFKPTQGRHINYILKITPDIPINQSGSAQTMEYAIGKPGEFNTKRRNEFYHVEDWDSTHKYDSIEEAHEAYQEIEFDEESIKYWIMKLIQDQRKSDLKDLVLDSITFENNILYLGNVEFTLVKYEYDTVEDLQTALGDSIDPDHSKDFEDARKVVFDQMEILHKILEKTANLVGEDFVKDIFNTTDKTKIIDRLHKIKVGIKKDFGVFKESEEGGKGRQISRTVGQGGNLSELYFDMTDDDNVKFKEAAENPDTELPLLPESKEYGNFDWLKERLIELYEETKSREGAKDEEGRIIMPRYRRTVDQEGEYEYQPNKKRLSGGGEESLTPPRHLNRPDAPPRQGRLKPDDEWEGEDYEDYIKRVSDYIQIPDGDRRRFRQIENLSITWNSKILDDIMDFSVTKNKLTVEEQKRILEDLEKLIGVGKSYTGKRKDRGLLDVLSQKSLKGKRLNLDIDFIGLWLDYKKGQNMIDFDLKDEPEFAEALESELINTSWAKKITSEGETPKDSGIHLPIVAYKKLNEHLKIKIDTRQYQIKNTEGFTGVKHRFHEKRMKGAKGMGGEVANVSKKDTNTLKKIIREFNRMSSMVN